MSYIDKIVSTARSFIGQEEIPQNQGFKDASFNAFMNDAGFYKGASWCGFFDIVVLTIVYSGSHWLPILKKHLSPGTILMWENFVGSKEFKTGQVPKVGAIVIWSEPNGRSGHTGLVMTVNDMNFTSVEGNTNSNGSSNGNAVCEHSHLATLTKDKTKRYILGFVYMPDID